MSVVGLGFVSRRRLTKGSKGAAVGLFVKNCNFSPHPNFIWAYIENINKVK